YDNSGTKNRRALLVGKSFRNRVHTILRRDEVLGVAAVHTVPGELRSVTQTLRSRAAVFASSIRFMQPRNSAARPDGESARISAKLLNGANHLMPGNDRRLARWQFAFNHV